MPAVTARVPPDDDHEPTRSGSGSPLASRARRAPREATPRNEETWRGFIPLVSHRLTTALCEGQHGGWRHDIGQIDVLPQRKALQVKAVALQYGAEPVVSGPQVNKGCPRELPKSGRMPTVFAVIRSRRSRCGLRRYERVHGGEGNGTDERKDR